MSHDPASPSARFILTAEAIDAMEGTEKVHFLNPNGRRTNKSLGDATGLKGFGIHLIEVPVGADSTEYHVHHQEDECVYVLSGQARVTLDEQTFDLGAGDFVGLPAGGPAHVFHNPGPDVLRCLVVGQRLTQRLYRHDGVWNLVDLANVMHPKAGAGSRVGSK